MRCIGWWTGTPKEYPWGMVLGTGWMIRCFCFLPLPLHAKTQSYPTSWTPLFIFLKEKKHGSRGNIPIFRKSSHTMFSSYSRPGFWCVTLIGISAQSGGNSWAMANPLNAPPTAFYPLCRSKTAVDVGWIEGCFDKGVSSFVHRRRTGLSKVTFLKVGCVKISQFLPRGLTQGELGKTEPTSWCAPGSWGWLWDWNFGSGPEISLRGLYTSHAYSEFFAFHNFFALHS